MCYLKSSSSASSNKNGRGSVDQIAVGDGAPRFGAFATERSSNTKTLEGLQNETGRGEKGGGERQGCDRQPLHHARRKVRSDASPDSDSSAGW